MPSIWGFRVACNEPAKVDGRAIHWMLSGMLDLGEGAKKGRRSPLAVAHHGAAKPYSIRSIEEIPGEKAVLVQVSVLDDPASAARSLSDDLLDGLEQKLWCTFSLNNIDASVQLIEVGGERKLAHLVRASTWDELRMGPPVDRWKLEFLTPTLIGSAGMPAHSVFESLSAASVRWAPPHAAVRFPRRADRDFDFITLSDDTTEARLHGDVEDAPYGRIGQRIYQIVAKALDDVSVADRCLVGSLLSLVEFAGLGKLTTFGNGAVSVAATVVDEP